MRDKKFIKDAAVISAGGFISKAIGAAYRIPLTGIIGCRGIGLYQIVFPLYCIFFALSSCGATSAVSKLTAENNCGGEGVYAAANRLFTGTGLIGAALMAVLSVPLSAAQGEARLAFGYMAIAPAVLFSSKIAVYRGYLQGRGYMLPSAAGEILEQAVKVALSLLFAYVFRGDVYASVTFILLSVTLSEAAALLFMRRSYKRVKTPRPLFKAYSDGKSVIRLALPVALSSFFLPLSGMADGAFLVKKLSDFFPSALSLYGVFSGGALTVINLPASVCYGFAAAAIPKISAAGKRGIRKNVALSLSLTAAVALPSAAVLLFAAPLFGLLFPSFSQSEKEVLVRLIKIMSFSALARPLAQTLSACLTGSGRAWRSVFSSAASAALKTAAAFLLINEKNGVYAFGYAVNVCYFSLFVLNLFLNLFSSRRKDKAYDYDSRIGRGGRRPYKERRECCSLGREGDFKERKNSLGGKRKIA